MIVLGSMREPQQHIGPVYSIARGNMPYPRIVVSSGGPLFVPTWEIITGHQQGRISDEQYIAVFKQILAKQLPEIKSWLELLDPADDLTLVCFCPQMRGGKQKFCHRQYVARVITHLRPELSIALY